MKTKFQEGCEAQGDPGEVPSSKKLWVAVEVGLPHPLFFCHVCRVSGLSPGQVQCISSQGNCFQSINHALSECAQYGEDPFHTGSSEAFRTSVSPPVIDWIMTHILSSWGHLNTMKDHVPHPGVSQGSWRLTYLDGYIGVMETHVLQVAWMLWKPVSSPGNLSALEICPVDPRRAQTLLFLRSLLSAHTVLLPHPSHSPALPPFSSTA